MSEYWSLNSVQFADLNIENIHGGHGLGFYRLIFQIKVITQNKPEEKQITFGNFSGELFVSGKNGKEYFLGHMHQEGVNSPLTTYTYSQSNYITFESELDAARIEAIEQIRLGGDLNFYLVLHGIGSDSQYGIRQLNQVKLRYPANQSTWIKILEEMEYRRTLLLELPLLPEEINPHFAKAIKHLQQAQTQMLQGHYRNAVGECRDVLETITSALGDEKGQTPETLKTWFQDTQNMSREERVRLMRRAFKVFSHASKHADENAASIEWSAVDARMAIAMASSLLHLSSGKD